MMTTTKKKTMTTGMTMTNSLDPATSDLSQAQVRVLPDVGADATPARMTMMGRAEARMPMIGRAPKRMTMLRMERA